MLNLGGIFRGTIAFFILTIFFSPVSAQDFTINKFHPDITINEDSSFAVKENTDVEFYRPRHGIYREIPPEWYVSHGGFRTFSPYSFSRSINLATSGFSSAMFSSPRGSGGSGGGGGGGFSGGGFGGGGGGSW